MNWESFDIAILGPAFAAGLLVLATHVPLGRQVLARGIIFIDLAVAQIAGLGVIAASALGWETHGWRVQAAATVAALAGAALLYVTERRWPQVQEAIIGVAFVLAASLGILLVSVDPHGGEALKDLLAGQILWVSYGQLMPVAVLYAAVLALWFWRGANGSSLWFYPLFALTVTASVQLVGVYLVFASLIIPALAVRGSMGRRANVFAYAHGALAYALGLVLSASLDWPAGPLIVWCLALAGVVAWGWNARQTALK
jgi:zinc/manganese transport system permease protein